MIKKHVPHAILGVLWFAAIASIAIEVAADCSSPTEASDLTIASVVIDGADADAQQHVDGTPPVTLLSDGVGVRLRSGDHVEYLPTGVAE